VISPCHGATTKPFVRRCLITFRLLKPAKEAYRGEFL
jgi:hypothetical protein